MNDIAKLMNGRPHQTRNWKTPEESMAMELDAAGLAKRCIRFLRLATMKIAIYTSLIYGYLPGMSSLLYAMPNRRMV
nr:hypothetical protein [Burkholderia anthina]